MEEPPAQTSKRKPGGLREAQRRFARQHILDAAVEVFIERGYTGATVEDIIDRAGTSRTTFYSHFRSKSHVIEELNAAYLPATLAFYGQLDEALTAGTQEALHDWMAAVIEWGDRYGPEMPFWEQAIATEPGVRKLKQEAVRSRPDAMPRYLGRWPENRQQEARLRIILLSIQLDRFFAHWPPREMDADDRGFVADVLTNIWYDALQASPLKKR